MISCGSCGMETPVEFRPFDFFSKLPGLPLAPVQYPNQQGKNCVRQMLLDIAGAFYIIVVLAFSIAGAIKISDKLGINFGASFVWIMGIVILLCIVVSVFEEYYK